MLGMGAIDDFLAATVTPQLVPGEKLEICAYAPEPTRFNALMVPVEHIHWLLAATNMRLFMFTTSVSMGMFANHPKAEARHQQVVWFDELKEVRLKKTQYGQLIPGGPPQAVVLDPHPTAGPDAGKPVAFHIFSKAEGLDNQERFATQFLAWLQGQVAAGAYPMSEEKRAQLAAAAAQRAEEARLQEIERQKRAAEFNKKLVPRLLTVGWFLVLFGLAFSAFIGFREWSRHGETRDEYLEKVNAEKKKIAKIESGELPVECAAGAKSCGPCFVGDAPEETKKGKKSKGGAWVAVQLKGEKWSCPSPESMGSFRDDYQKQADDWGGQATLGLVQLLGSLAGFGGWIALGVFMRKRSKRKLAAATAEAPAPA